MEQELGGRMLEIDEDGFIQDPDQWDKAVAADLAKTEGVEDKNVPFLSDIPLIGFLFKKHTKVNESKELVILLKATVDQVGL